MTQIPPSETNLESLKQMTGAPDIEQPLLKDDAFATEEVHSARPTWKLPIPKLMLIGGALLPVFAFAGYFMMSSQQPRRPEVATSIPQKGGEQSKPDEAEELRQAREEIATLKSKMALNDQEYIQTQRAASGQRERPSTAALRQTSQDRPRVQSAPSVVRPVSSAPVISYRPPDRPIQVAPLRSVRAVQRADRAAQIDPAEQWQQLARLGSYGTITPSESVSPSEVVGSQRNPESKQGILVTSASQIPTARIAPTSADQPIPETTPRSINDFEWADTGSRRALLERAMEIAEAVNSESAVNQGIAEVAARTGSDPMSVSQLQSEGAPARTEEGEAFNEGAIALNKPDPSSEAPENQEVEASTEVAPYPIVLVEAESAILEEQSQMQAVTIGANATGRLETPVILANTEQQGRFLVVLAEPLKDNRGRVAIPANGKLLVQVDSISEDGAVKLSATQAVWQTEAGQREMVLPEQVIVIRGEDGEPLIAEQHDDRGPEIAAMDVGQFALGAIGRAAELFTRANTRVQTGNGTTIITESNPAPNILAGVLEGGADAILESITRRNERAAQELEQRPNIPYIKAGTPVQIFVNQSMQLPM